jgi:arabinose-5-phosphate isomerase
LNSKEIIQVGKQVIEIEAKTIANLVSSVNEQFVKAIDVLYNSQGRVVLTGMGKSGLIARKIVATLNSTGTAAIYMHPTDALHGDLGMVRKEDVVIIISKSGLTEELHKLLPMFKRLGVKIIAMSGNSDSMLAREADIVLNIYVEEEACPHDLAPTSSTTAALVMGDALSVALLEKRGFTAEDFALLHPGGSLGKRLSLRIEEVMIKGDGIPLVGIEAPIKEVILEMTTKRLGATGIVDNDGTLYGIFTDGDLRRLLEKTMDIKDLKAKDIATRNPKVIKKDYLASFALQNMENYKITSIIVVDNENKPIGILHLHELVNLGLQRR